ncbi:DUF177 domain-containing protein [Sphingobium bisphenolivorans]|uniref:DUF177 domain-containing protein n=1 Tax=Sphingobium bisphenolivorans TaxID=1335760 RepID=UPI0003A71C15|nr:DUF177 domain-containing protein [Sphingobium bisphenolivorans]
MSDTPAPEFSRPVRVDQLARHAKPVTITAEPAECEALARRFNLSALDRLEADYALSEENGAIYARGRVRADLAQPCVATGAAVPERIDTDFVLHFVAAEEEAVEGDELELDAEDCDTILYDGQLLDIGEAVAETLALSMEPYPRAPDADKVLREAGVLTEEQASPFAALLSLKDKK